MRNFKPRHVLHLTSDNINITRSLSMWYFTHTQHVNLILYIHNVDVDAMPVKKSSTSSYDFLRRAQKKTCIAQRSKIKNNKENQNQIIFLTHNWTHINTHIISICVKKSRESRSNDLIIVQVLNTLPCFINYWGSVKFTHNTRHIQEKKCFFFFFAKHTFLQHFL